MMKRILMIALGAAMISGCRHSQPMTDAPGSDDEAKPKNYVALPGQAATSSTPTETATAFEFAAAAYAQQTAAQATPTTPAAAGNTAAPPIPDPRPVASTGLLSGTAPSAVNVTAHSTGPISPASMAPYALQVTNGTSGRLFVEAQDESGNIFPFGFMYAGQRIGTQPQEPRLIGGKLIIVLRDPDRTGAPVLRRYYIDPPADYEGKTLGITLLPGGRYRILLDGQVYYTSPDPQPAAPATPAA